MNAVSRVCIFISRCIDTEERIRGEQMQQVSSRVTCLDKAACCLYDPMHTMSNPRLKWRKCLMFQRVWFMPREQVRPDQVFHRGKWLQFQLCPMSSRVYTESRFLDREPERRRPRRLYETVFILAVEEEAGWVVGQGKEEVAMVCELKALWMQFVINFWFVVRSLRMEEIDIELDLEVVKKGSLCGRVVRLLLMVRCLKRWMLLRTDAYDR